MVTTPQYEGKVNTAPDLAISHDKHRCSTKSRSIRTVKTYHGIT